MSKQDADAFAKAIVRRIVEKAWQDAERNYLVRQGKNKKVKE